MAINLATKYESKVAERFAQKSKTDEACGHDYEFSGVKEIKVYSVDTVNTTAYTRSGTSRFGTLNELGDTVQTMTLTQDRAFTFSVDNGNNSEQLNIKGINKALKRQWDEVCTPEIDAYRLTAWATGHGLSSGKTITTKTAAAALTKANIVEEIFNASAQMSDDNVPATERTLFIPELMFVNFRLADVVMGADKLNAENIQRGYRGTIDGMRVVTVPSSVWTKVQTEYNTKAGTTGKVINFILKYKGATVDPMKLKVLRATRNPVGIDGDVAEGRFIYDAFVLDAKCKGVLIDIK